jgi:hypothetical protein
MGFVKESKQNTAVMHARRSAGEGHTVFLYRFDVPATSSGLSGPVSGAAEVIEGIEQQGWNLAEMAFDRAQSKNGAVLLLFRRRPAPPPAQGGGLREYYAAHPAPG